MVRPTTSPRWSGDCSHPSANYPAKSRNYVVFEAGGENEAAVERWIATHPATQGQHSPPTTGNQTYGESPVAASPASTPNSGKPTKNSRGKRLLRERLQRAKQIFHHQQQLHQYQSQEKQESFSRDYVPASVTEQSIDTDGGVVLRTKEPVTTPSTAASTRSPSSHRSFSFQNMQSSSPLSDTSSPQVRRASISPSREVTPLGSRSLRERRELEISTLQDSTRKPCLASGSPNRQADPGDTLVMMPPSVSRRQLPTEIPSDLPAVPSHTDASGSSIVPAAAMNTRRQSRGSFFGNSRSRSETSAQRLVESNSSVVAVGARKSGPKQRTAEYTAHESDEEREKSETRIQHPVTRQIAIDSRQADSGSPSPPVARANRIQLHVYDLIAEGTIMQLPWGILFPIGQCFNAVNEGLHTLGTGAYHVGVEINGIEYAFGANNTYGLTGVFTCLPKSSPGFQYRTTIDFGEQTLTRKLSRRGDDLLFPMPSERHVDGREVIREMASEYMGTDYDLLRKNCVTFAHDACVRLGVNENEIPDWFRNLCVAGALAQDAANFTIEPLTRVFSACDMEGFTDMVKDNADEEQVAYDSVRSVQAQRKVR